MYHRMISSFFIYFHGLSFSKEIKYTLSVQNNELTE